MPMYEYQCGSCGRRFEQLQRMADDPLTTDPECGGPVRRVIQPVGIIFKGSGFYATDSRKSSSSSSSGGDTKSETKTETKTESKGESKSESSSSSSTTSDSPKPAAAAAS